MIPRREARKEIREQLINIYYDQSLNDDRIALLEAEYRASEGDRKVSVANMAQTWYAERDKLNKRMCELHTQLQVLSLTDPVIK
jgi:hypothetical protein